MASRQPARAYPDLPWRTSPPLVPEGTDRSIVTAMTGLLADFHPGTDAEALQLLRSAYPDYPLSVRLVALAHMPR